VRSWVRQNKNVMKAVRLTQRALEQCRERGAAKLEVEQAIMFGEREPAHGGRWLYRRNYEYCATWYGKYYRVKQVVPVIAEKASEIVVITVYTYYF